MNLEKLGIRLAKKQITHKKKFMTLLTAIILLSMPGILLLINNIEPSLEKVLPQQELVTMNNMRGQFGADMMYILIRTESPATEITQPEVLKYIKILSERLEQNPFILDVYSIYSMMKETNGYIPKDSDETKRLIKKHPMSSLYLNDDYSLTFIQIRSDTGAEAKIIKEVIDQINHDIESIEEYNPGVSISITGFNAIDKATFEVIIKDFAFITGFSFLFMLIFLGFYFRDLKKVSASVSVIIIAVLVTLGITGYLGITITVVTMVAAAMIMALGISYGINVVHAYHILRKKHSKNKTLEELNKDLIRALVGSSLTTSAGFLALLAGVLPAMKNLGIVLAIGITVTLITSIVFLPVIIFKLDKTKKDKTKKVKRR